MGKVWSKADDNMVELCRCRVTARDAAPHEGAPAPPAPNPTGDFSPPVLVQMDINIFGTSGGFRGGL